MKHVTRKSIYRLMAVLSIYCSFMPLFTIPRYEITGTGIDLCGFVLPLAMLMGGFFFGTFLVRDDSVLISKLLASNFIKTVLFFGNKKLSVRGITLAAAYTSAVLPAALSVLINRGQSLWLLLIDAVVFIFFYLAGIRSSLRSLDEIYTRGYIISGTLVLAVALLMTYFLQDILFLRNYILISSYLFILAGMFIRNELMIEKGVMGRRDSDKRAIPGSIRRYNNIAVIIVFGIILLMFNFKNTVAFMLNIAKQVVFFIILLFIQITALIFPAGKGSGEASSPDKMDLPKEVKPGSHISDYLLYAFTIVILLYICYKLLPVIYRAFRQLLVKLAAFLKNLVSPASANLEQAEYEYYDEVEIIKEEKNPNKVKGKRNLNRMGSLRKAGDPASKIRLLYKYVISYFIRQGINIDSSDTTREISLKAAKTLDAGVLMDNITQIYENVRYGDYVPDISEADSAVKAYSAIVKRPGKTGRPMSK